MNVFMPFVASCFAIAFSPASVKVKYITFMLLAIFMTILELAT